MHIEFKKLTIHNFMSFGESILNFRNDGFIRVTGINNNVSDNAISNGSGKSSLWEAIVWAITGDTIRGTKHIVNMNGDDGCFVDLEFNIDNKKYRIIRSKDHAVYKTNLQIFIDGEDVSGKGIRDSNNLLQQYLPDITASLIGSVIILGQGLPQKFTNNTPSGRKEVLEKLSKSDFMIEDLKQKVANRKSELQKELRDFEDSILKSTTQKSVLSTQITECQAILDSLNHSVLRSEADSYELELTRLTTSVTEMNELFEELSDKQETLKSLENTVIAAHTEEMNKEKADYAQLSDSDKQELNVLETRLSMYTSELTRLQSVKDICPTCGQKIIGVHKPDTQDLENNIKLTSDAISEVTVRLTQKTSMHLSRMKEIEDTYAIQRKEHTDNLKSITVEYNDIKNQLKTLQDEKSVVELKLSELNSKITRLESTVALNQKIIQDNTEKIGVIDDDILYNNMQKDLTQSHIDVVSKFETALKRDFRGYLLSTVIDYIQAKAQQYCSIIFDTTDLCFCLDGNNIDIRYLNKPYENLSGGEKQKVDLIIQFSIRDMLSSQLNFTSNILVLDEVFDGLDTTGCNRVIDMISKLSDVNNVFIVTHRKDLSLPSDRELTVVKSSVGISEILT